MTVGYKKSSMQMKHPSFLKLTTPVQHYDWGSTVFLHHFLGLSSQSKKPIAELWVSAHSKAPSRIENIVGKPALPDWITQHAPTILGKQHAATFKNNLPFLLKLISVNHPLSIQAHPNLKQATNEFKKETRRSISLQSSKRKFKDPFDKPEMLVALSPFTALCGTRSSREISQIWKSFNHPVLRKISIQTRGNVKKLLKIFFTLRAQNKDHSELITSVLKTCQKKKSSGVFKTILKLHQYFPHDIGILAPSFMNLVHLKPGQALFLAPGALHSYLSGNGIEVMRNSDNVIRGALTSKPVDPVKLLSIIDFKNNRPIFIKPTPILEHPSSVKYPVKTPYFSLQVLSIKKQTRIKNKKETPTFLLCLKGKAVLVNPATQEKIPFKQGQAYFIPAKVSDYLIVGNAKVITVSLPD